MRAAGFAFALVVGATLPVEPAGKAPSNASTPTAPARVHAPPPARVAPPSPPPSPSPPETEPAPEPADADAIYESDESLPAHAEDVVDYTLRATLDPAAHVIHGEGTIRWRNTSSVPVHELWLHLYLNAFKNERSTFLREPVGGFRGSEPMTDWGYVDVHRFALHDGDQANDLWPSAELHRPGDDDETDVRVPLPHEVPPNASLSIDVAWDSKLPTVLERTGYLGSFHFAGQWFPKIARLEPNGRWAHFPFHHLAEFYSDFGTYDVTLDVPESFVIGATGVAVMSKVENGRRVERRFLTDVHDFAWTAWDKWQTAKRTIDGVAVTILYPPGFQIPAERELAAMEFSIPHFGEKYGRYPYPVLTLVHPPERASEAGGMEYPTLITTGGPWYGPPGVFINEIVTVHEYGHQYFYGMVATDEVTWPYLDEGLNSYAETEAMGAWRGAASAVDLLGLHVSDTAAEAANSRKGEHDQPVAQPAFAFTTGSAYGSLVYSRTATIFETLRRVYGDEAVTRAFGRYARKWRFRHPVPEDLTHAFEGVLGPSVAYALQTALFHKGWIDYAVTDIFSKKTAKAAGVFDREGKRETVAPGDADEKAYEGWVLVTRRGSLRFPVDIALTLDDGTVQRVRWDGEGDSIRVPYHGAVGLRAAVVDPDQAILLDDQLTNNFATVAAETRATAPRTFERASYWGELLLQLVGP